LNLNDDAYRAGVNRNPPATIWTVGHSKRSSQELIEALESYGIKLLADVRRFPNSRKNPHFNQQELTRTLLAAGIDYVHFPELGGRRAARPDSHNTAWRNASFRGYADYMETSDFKAGIERLIDAAGRRRVAIMCSEAVWWRCHRGLISDYLKSLGYEVIHILTPSDSKHHPFTPAARFVDGKLSYRE
jgi:uncharacterized protein (DUF488 family)